MELEARAVELVRSTLGHDVYHRALVAAILRREVIRNDLKLLHRVLVRNEEVRTANRQVVIVGTVQGEVI